MFGSVGAGLISNGVKLVPVSYRFPVFGFGFRFLAGFLVIRPVPGIRSRSGFLGRHEVGLLEGTMDFKEILPSRKIPGNKFYFGIPSP